MDREVFRAHADVEGRHWWFTARRMILRTVVEHVAPADGSRYVVDIGCGVGANAPAFHPGYRYTGYDPSADAVMFAAAAHTGVTFKVGGAADAAPDLVAADAVLLTDVIEHVSDDHGLLREVIEPMTPGAHLLVTVPAHMELWSPHDVALGHYRRYDRTSLDASWKGLPVEPVLVSYFNSRLYPIVRAVRWLTTRLDRAAGDQGTDFTVPPAPVNRLLHNAFLGEGQRLKRVLIGRSEPYARGVSLIALLRRG